MSNLIWYLRRFLRMTPLEWLHRAAEFRRRQSDRRWHNGWQDFGAFGAVRGLPGLRPGNIPAAVRGEAISVAERLTAGERKFLGQEWPKKNEWWAAPDGWFLDPASGQVWPSKSFGHDIPYRFAPDFGDIKFVWELNRLQFLPALILAGRPEVAFRLLFSWMDANPPWRGVNWTVGLEAAARLVSVFSMLSLAGNIELADDPRLAAFVDAHATWIRHYPSLYSSANNHRIAELTGLVLCGACAASMPGAAQQARVAWDEMEHRIQSVFHKDGIGVEQSPAYASYVLEWFLIAAIAAQHIGFQVSLAFRERVFRAANALLWMSDAAGNLPAIGDDDEGRVVSLGAAEQHYPQSVAAFAMRWLDCAVPAADLRAPALRDALACRPISVMKPLSGVHSFREGGYTVWRRDTSQGLALLTFDHGPLGFLSIAAHGHADALALWLHWGEDKIFVDAGTYLYHAGRGLRDRFRATVSHNTLTIDSANQSRIIGPFAWAEHARVTLLHASEKAVTAQHGGYRARFGLIHRRKLFWESNAIIVEDYLLGRPYIDGLEWNCGFTIGPEVKLDFAEPRCALLHTTRRNMRLTIEKGGVWSVVEGFYSPAFNSFMKLPRLTVGGRLAVDKPGLVAQIKIEFCE